MHDLLVVGGGPVGLATALYAARAGLDVVVFEARSLPVDKACGEGLMPGAVRRLGDLGVGLDGRPFAGIAYVDDRHRAEARFRLGAGLGVRRTVLHDALHDAVRRCGIEVVAERAAPEFTSDDVRVGAHRGRYLVAADGLHSPIRHRLGLDRPHVVRHRWGLRRHFDVAPWSDLVEVHWPTSRRAGSTEAYVTPVGDGRVGVAVLSERRGSFDEHLSAFPALRERLTDAAGGTTLGAGPLRQRSTRRVLGRTLLVGDAAGYVDALTGEGIAVGLAEAEALVRCVHAGRPHDYEREWRRVTREYRTVTGGLLWARRRRLLAGTIVPSAQRFPSVFALAVGRLGA